MQKVDRNTFKANTARDFSFIAIGLDGPLLACVSLCVDSLVFVSLF